MDNPSIRDHKPRVRMPPGFVHNQKAGTGSTLVMGDFYGCRADVARNPEKLHELMERIIRDQKLTVREESLDFWNVRTDGPSTSYRTLAESHTRAASMPWPHSFARAEAWTEEEHNMHVNADAQVCNYSALNRDLPFRMMINLAKELDAGFYYLMAVQRGPGCLMHVIESPRLVIVRGFGLNAA